MQTRILVKIIRTSARTDVRPELLACLQLSGHAYVQNVPAILPDLAATVCMSDKETPESIDQQQLYRLRPQDNYSP